MKVVERARLSFQAGTSDKVYEVDLVEVAAGQFVVNFRYGRRGSALREGTKTPLPLPEPKARVVFRVLVEEKVKGGYVPLAASSAAAASEPSPVEPKVAPSRKQALLDALALGHRSATPLHWVVRRVGEQGYGEAEPALLELLAGSAQTQIAAGAFRHFVLLALLRCGSSRALPALRAIAENAKEERHLRLAALLALTQIGGVTERQRARASTATSLLGDESDLGKRVRAAEQLLASSTRQGHDALFALYAGAAERSDASGDEAEQSARRVVLAAARIARPQGVELGLLRSLNWAAEARRDAELFALLARRFEGDGFVEVATSQYLRRRSARTLRRLGRGDSPDYVAFASELLLSYRDEDAEPVVDHSEYGTWDAFGRFHALNFVLYGRSARYEKAGHRRATWRCRAGYAPGDPAPSPREESFPWLWDRAPAALWRVGVSSAAGVAIDFAVRALRDQADYLEKQPDEALASALAGAQQRMKLLALDVARQREPNAVLLRGAVAAKLEEADSWVLAWLASAPSPLTTNIELWAVLLCAPGERVRRASARLAGATPFEAEVARRLVASVVATLMQLSDAPDSEPRACDATAFLLRNVPQPLGELSIAVVGDLLAHPLSGVAALGAELVLLRARLAPLPEGLLDGLLASRHAAVRSVGARIVAETPPELMKDEPELLAHLALSDNAELRAGTRQLLGNVAQRYPDVGRDVASRLLDALLTRQAEGVPAHVVSLLRQELRACLPKRDAADVLALTAALSPHARQAGGLLLALLAPDELQLAQIVRLFSHEVLLVRQGAWALAEAARGRFRVTPVALARLCDATWEDSRAFAFDFVKSFPPEVLVPDTVIAICDSTEPLVQELGQSLLLAHFREEHAERYLLRLSEHPSVGIQLLVSGLLERHARGKLPILEQLLPCFATVLSQVNRGGVAKQRLLAFLRTESVASAEAAALLAPLLERQSLTRAVSHKQPLIATMVDVQQRYPDVAVPLATPPVPVRARSNRGV